MYEAEVHRPPGRQLPISLVPLRAEGPGSLDTADIPGLKKVTLIELETTCCALGYLVSILRADDIFQAISTAPPSHRELPLGSITRAVFDFQFTDGQTATVQIVTPNKVICPAAYEDIIKIFLDHRHFIQHSAQHEDQM